MAVVWWAGVWWGAPVKVAALAVADLHRRKPRSAPRRRTPPQTGRCLGRDWRRRWPAWRGRPGCSGRGSGARGGGPAVTPRAAAGRRGGGQGGGVTLLSDLPGARDWQESERLSVECERTVNRRGQQQRQQRRAGGQAAAGSGERSRGTGEARGMHSFCSRGWRQAGRLGTAACMRRWQEVLSLRSASRMPARQPAVQGWAGEALRQSCGPRQGRGWGAPGPQGRVARRLRRLSPRRASCRAACPWPH